MSENTFVIVLRRLENSGKRWIHCWRVMSHNTSLPVYWTSLYTLLRHFQLSNRSVNFATACRAPRVRVPSTVSSTSIDEAELQAGASVGGLAAAGFATGAVGRWLCRGGRSTAPTNDPGARSSPTEPHSPPGSVVTACKLPQCVRSINDVTGGSAVLGESAASSGHTSPDGALLPRGLPTDAPVSESSSIWRLSGVL